jgi:TPR repeat protein
MRQARNGRIGTIMVTPTKLPANDRLSPLMRSVVISSDLLAFGLVVALSLPTLQSGTAPSEAKEAAKPLPVLTAENAVELCKQLFEEPKEYIDDIAKRRRWDLRRESCKMAHDANPANADLKAAYARNLPYAQKAEAVVMLREAAAQGSAEAYYQLYEHHRSWDRDDLDKVPLVTRAEAAQALRRAAELGHAFSTQMLIRQLEDGDIVKRDPVAARYWAERAVAKDASKGSLLTLGRLLAASDKLDERARGLDILEGLNAPGQPYQFGARRELALAIRKDDPVRARGLLEEARRPDPGGAIVPLAEMLIAGEGGPADPKRAVSLLKGTSDSWMAEGMLGRLTLEGRLVARDVQKAVTMIDRASTWDIDARMQVVRLLAEFPEVQVNGPKRVLYDAVQAAELCEPGAMKALIELKLSANAQFQDRPGACKLIETAVSRGDQTMAQRLADCRAG